MPPPNPINTKLLRQGIRLLERMERSINAFFDQNKRATSEHQQSAEHERQYQPPIEIRSELSLPVAVREYCESQQRERQSPWRKVKYGLEIIAVGTAICLAILTWMTLRKIRSQADSAQQQVAIMQRQLEATDRPWVEITSATITSNAYIFQKPELGPQPVMTMAVQIRGKNVGRSVAQNVKLKSDMVFQSASDFGNGALQAQSITCAKEHAINITPELTLFPDEETGDDRFHGGFWSAISTAVIERQGDVNMIQPLVVGCIVYDISGASDNPHHTGFIYKVEPRVGKDIELPWRITYALGKRFLRSDLRLREFEGFSDAN